MNACFVSLIALYTVLVMLGLCYYSMHAYIILCISWEQNTSLFSLSRGSLIYKESPVFDLQYDH